MNDFIDPKTNLLSSDYMAIYDKLNNENQFF